MEIRGRIKNIIYDALNYGFFRFEDFDVAEQGNFGLVLKISYEKYFFRMEFYEYESKCDIKFSPGKILMEDTSVIKLSDFEHEIERLIRVWLNMIKEDLLNPLEMRFVENSIQEFKSEIENKLKEIEDEYFTKEEGIQLKEKLERIESMILDKADQEEMQSEILKMQQEIEFLKATVDTLTKKKWLKNMLIKIWVWGQKEENQRLIKSGVDAVKTISQIDVPKI